MEERLQKVIANRGFCSRRKAEELIGKGFVTVNGEIVTSLGTKVKLTDQIEVEGILLEKQEMVYYLLNKPRGYISTAEDEFNRPVVTELIASNSVNERLYPVGRLDRDTTGVLLLTNDGDFMYAMTHPKFHVRKTYVATVEGSLRQSEAESLLKGVFIEQGVKVFADDVFVQGKNRQSDTTIVEVVIHEGKYHQVKRMFEVLGYPVKKLKRTKYGELELGTMAAGSHRKLKKAEVLQLLQQANTGEK
ncbi:MAG: pseudouridine synthase [Culicoidibacterales bacterium]